MSRKVEPLDLMRGSLVLNLYEFTRKDWEAASQEDLARWEGVAFKMGDQPVKVVRGQGGTYGLEDLPPSYEEATAPAPSAPKLFQD